MLRLAFVFLLLAPGAALAQDASAPQAVAPSAAPAAAAEAPEVKHDQGTVRTIDAQRGTCIADMPDGPVTYDISQAQLIDLAGKPAGVATAGLKTGDKIRITYTVDASCPHAPACRGAIASEVRRVK
jgi:hypothetical protein